MSKWIVLEGPEEWNAYRRAAGYPHDLHPGYWPVHYPCMISDHEDNSIDFVYLDDAERLVRAAGKHIS